MAITIAVNKITNNISISTDGVVISTAEVVQPITVNTAIPSVVVDSSYLAVTPSGLVTATNVQGAIDQLAAVTEANDLTTTVNWADVPDANITESSVVQYITSANVSAAGALMDSEVTNLAQVKAFDSSDYATAAQGSTADSALQNLIEDTNPQLGGQLDGQNNAIVSVSSLATSGNILASTGSITTVTGDIVTTSGNIQASSGNITAGGNIVVGGTVDGVDIATRDAVLSTTTTTANSAMQDLVDDTTPQLGGDLDLNGNDITGTGNISITQSSTSTPALHIYNADTSDVASPTIRLERRSGGSTVDDDSVGKIEFYGFLQSVPPFFSTAEYANITGVLNDADSNSKDGQLDFNLAKDNTLTTVMSLTSTALELPNATNLNVAGDITASNLNITTTGSITTNLASGADFNATGQFKTVNIGTGYNANTTNINIGASSANADSNVNIYGDIAVDGTVDGRDVAADGARLDTIPYHRVNEVALRTAPSGTLTLTTILQNVGNITDIIHPSTPVDCSRYVDLKLYLDWRYVNSGTNDLELQAQVIVPANATVVNMGTVTMMYSSSIYTQSGFEYWGYVSGDYTHHFTEFGRVNSTGLASTNAMRVRAWQYDEANDRTYFLHDSNPGVSLSTGDTVYWHPYDWESAGTTLTKTIEIDERYVSYGHQSESLKFKVAYDDSRLTYRFKLKELATTDSAVLDLASVTFTDVGKV